MCLTEISRISKQAATSCSWFADSTFEFLSRNPVRIEFGQFFFGGCFLRNPRIFLELLDRQADSFSILVELENLC